MLICHFKSVILCRFLPKTCVKLFGVKHKPVHVKYNSQYPVFHIHRPLALFYIILSFVGKING